MRTQMMFAFLKEDCPLFSRALIAPWRLCFLAAGLVILCVGSHVTPSDDWDYPISFIMGVSAYVFAPWTVRALVYRRWKWLVVAFLFMWVSIDGVYSLYWWSRGFDALQIFRGANAIYCLPLYFALGFAMNIEIRRGEASTAGLLRSYFAWVQKHALHVLTTGFLILLFALGILLATGNYRLRVTSADDSRSSAGIIIEDEAGTSIAAGRAVAEYVTSSGSAVVRSGNKADCVVCKNSSSNLRERDLSTFDLKSTTNLVGVSLSYKLEIKRKSI